MVSGKMPRRFWVYTAGKDDPEGEKRAEAQAKILQWIPGLVGFGVVLLLTLYMLLMMFAEFRGFYLDQFVDLFRVR